MTALPVSHPHDARRAQDRPLALVTGASSGIGREMAQLLARDGHDLLLVARRRSLLDTLARDLSARHDIACEVFPADLARRLEREHLVARMRTLGERLDVLVNNAGFGAHGYFHETDLERELEMIEVNVAALTHLSKAVLPTMLARRRGRIVNISSVAAFQPGPLMAVYYASKAYVQSFSEALAEEVAGTGVTVTAICPGPTTTEFQIAAGILAHAPAGGAPPMTSEAVAAAAYAGMTAGKRVVITGVRNKLAVLTSRLLSRRAMTRIVRRIQERRRAPRR